MESILSEINNINKQLHDIDVTDYLLTEINPTLPREDFIKLNLQLQERGHNDMPLRNIC